MDVERKGIQSYQSDIYARFLCFGNGALTALYDHSDGFWRRQLVLTTKDRPANREDNPFLVEALSAELEGILLWCEDNACHPVSAARLSSEVSQNAIRLNLKPTNNIYLPGGRRVRGFMGIEALVHPAA